ncbi:MAG TPA: secretin N-terminal domain-containing protein [Pyrinomonadaceae bacterium]
MKTQTRNPIVSLIVVLCLLVVPLTAFAKKGRDHFKRGLKHEQAQQWDKAAQEYTLALASDPSNAEFQLHYRRAIFNASQMFMQQGRAMAEQRDYVGAYNAFRQAFGYDPVNQLAVSEMERMLRLQEVKEGGAVKAGSTSTAGTGGTPAGATKPGEEPLPQSTRPEQLRQGNFNGDLKHYIRTLAEQLGLNVVFDKQSFAQPRTLDMVLTQPVTTAKALDYIFLQESLFFQKLDRHTILVADQARRPQYQQLVVRTFFISNADPEKVKTLIGMALPASVGRPSMIVVADKDTNSLTVRDTAENVRLIGELIQSIDKDRAEVVMDVDIYEVSQSDLLQFGNQIGTGVFNIGGSPGFSLLTDNAVTQARTAAENTRGVNVASIVGGVPTALAAALVIPPSVLTAFRSKDNTKLIASTQVHAFNGEESKARIGQRVPVQTAQAYPFGVQTGTPTPGQGSQGIFPSGGFPVINYEPTGLTLTFTPQVFPNLDVQVKMNIESKDVLGGEGLTPTFTERTITGTARVQNNRTMLLASVSQDVETKGRRGLPFLGGLPYVGRLFTSPTRSNRRVDIVIAVTPRVLRAPALTPRDEEMRPSGTLQSPTTGSLEAMLQENAREEQILSARRIPKEVNVQLPDAPAYVPAANTETQTQAANNNGVPTQATTVAQNNGAAKTEPAAVTTNQAAATNGTNSPAANDSTMPQPKAASFAPQTPATETNKLDVATAIKSVVTPATEVTATSASAKTDANVTAAVEDLAPKPAVTDATAKSAPLPAVIELGFASEQTQLTVGEKRQISLELNSPAPLGVAVVMLRFDPGILKVTNVTAGKMLADAKSAPTISVMRNEGGVLLVSIAPAAGAAISGEGALLNLEVEGLAGGNSSLAFDLSSVHVVTADGSASVVQVSSPVTVAVKAAAAAAKP